MQGSKTSKGHGLSAKLEPPRKKNSIIYFFKKKEKIIIISSYICNGLKNLNIIRLKNA